MRQRVSQSKPDGRGREITALHRSSTNRRDARDDGNRWPAKHRSRLSEAIRHTASRGDGELVGLREISNPAAAEQRRGCRRCASSLRFRNLVHQHQGERVHRCLRRSMEEIDRRGYAYHSEQSLRSKIPNMIIWRLVVGARVLSSPGLVSCYNHPRKTPGSRSPPCGDIPSRGLFNGAVRRASSAQEMASLGAPHERSLSHMPHREVLPFTVWIRRASLD